MGGFAKHSFYLIISYFLLPIPPIPNISSASLYPLFLSYMKISSNIFGGKVGSNRERERVVLGVIGVGGVGSIMTFV